MPAVIERAASPPNTCISSDRLEALQQVLADPVEMPAGWRRVHTVRGSLEELHFSSSSICWMWTVSAGWAMCSRSAARVMLPRFVDGDKKADFPYVDHQPPRYALTSRSSARNPAIRPYELRAPRARPTARNRDRPLPRQRDILLDQQNTHAARPQCADRSHDLPDHQWRQPGGRFVQDQELRLQQQRAPERDHLLLPAAHQFDRIVETLAQERE